MTSKEVRFVVRDFSFPLRRTDGFQLIYLHWGDSNWIAELDKRIKTEARARANGGGGDGPEGSGKRGGG